MTNLHFSGWAISAIRFSRIRNVSLVRNEAVTTFPFASAVSWRLLVPASAPIWPLADAEDVAAMPGSSLASASRGAGVGDPAALLCSLRLLLPLRFEAVRFVPATGEPAAGPLGGAPLALALALAFVLGPVPGSSLYRSQSLYSDMISCAIVATSGRETLRSARNATASCCSGSE